MGRLLTLVLLLVLPACGDEPASSPEPRSVRATAQDSTIAPTTLYDDAPVVYDTVEIAPSEMVFAAPREDPPVPAPIPVPDPAPPPVPPQPPRPARPPPTERGVSGSCDVRSTENFCFTYTGPSWTPTTASAHCRLAPSSAFASVSCPSSGRIATCTFVRDEQMLVYSYYAPYALELARLACPGEFVAAGD